LTKRLKSQCPSNEDQGSKATQKPALASPPPKYTKTPHKLTKFTRLKRQCPSNGASSPPKYTKTPHKLTKFTRLKRQCPSNGASSPPKYTKTHQKLQVWHHTSIYIIYISYRPPHILSIHVYMICSQVWHHNPMSITYTYHIDPHIYYIYISYKYTIIYYIPYKYTGLAPHLHLYCINI
jgi:hypothetical protein